MLSKEIEENILSKVQKPARYIGSEINQIKKDFLNTDLKMAICYPDLYEIGMSNLGLKILYELINKQDNMLCERVFHPWVDMADTLRNQNIPLYSLESKRYIKDFDILGFSLQYELNFTNTLSILDLSHIPIESKNRKENHPIVIAGGPCVYNPQPMADFIDLFLIGEAEEGIIILANKLSKLKKLNKTRKDILKELATLPFVYVPLFSKDKTIERLAINDINNNKYPIKPPIPYIQIVQDQGVIEVSRGCTVGCRFCQAGMIYRPIRERSIENIIELAEQIVDNTGYKRISLLSLSIADYTNLGTLIDKLNEHFSHKNISFSFPSLRIDAFSLDNALKIKKVRKTALTFAIEAGSEYTRSIINKSVSEDKLFKIVTQITKLGWRQIKLYFMLGFPIPKEYESTEEEDIIKLINTLLSINKKLNISVSIGTFIPKTHTPFETIPQITMQEASQKINIIRNAIRNRRITFKIHPVEMSFIEGLIARGDRKIGQLIYKAYKKGSIFDGWHDKFNIKNWTGSIEEMDIDIKQALFHNYEKDDEKKLPWSNISCGVTNRFLGKEFDKSAISEESPDCRDKCHDFCGVCNRPLNHKLSEECDNHNYSDNSSYKDTSFSKLEEDAEKVDTKAKNEGDTTHTLIIKFIKEGVFRFLSHIDVFSLFQKAFTRAKLPIVFSNGFNPIPKIEIANPLALGIESKAEYMQVRIKTYLSPLYIKEKLNKKLTEGIQITNVFISKESIPKMNKLIEAAEYRVRLDDSKKDQTNITQNIAILEKLEEIPAYRKEQTRQNLLLKTRYYENGLDIAFNTKEGANLFDYLTFITKKEKEELIALKIQRLMQYGDYKQRKDPISCLEDALTKKMTNTHVVC